MTPGNAVRLWWILQVFFLGAGVFFLLFGVHVLLLAYRLEDPFFFVMTFFASNLIILISATIVAGLAIRLATRIFKSNKDINSDN